MRVDIEKYTEIASSINAVGLTALRNYCTTKKHPVKTFDRDVQILRCILKHGPTECVVPFGISKQRADQIMRRYHEYALECMARKAGGERC